MHVHLSLQNILKETRGGGEQCTLFFHFCWDMG